MNNLTRRFSIFLKASYGEESRHEVFRSVWKEYHARIQFFVRSFTGLSPSEEEDIAQDIMLKVYRNLHRYNPLYSFTTWIYRIARNHCLDVLRHSVKTRAIFRDTDADMAESHSSQGANPESDAIHRELRTIIEEGLRELRDADRQVAYLRFYEDMKYRDISKIMGIPSGTLKYRIHEIKEILKQKLDRLYEEYSRLGRWHC